VLRLSVRAAGSSGSEIAEVRVPAALGPWPSMLRIGGPEHELASGFVVRRLMVETPEDEVGPRPVPPSNPPRPSVIARRGSNPRAGVPPTPDVFEIASRLGDSGPDLPRHVDLDGDGDVTVLDLSAALRIQRESIGRRGVSRPTRSSAPAP
jgi:hypothetical protein